MMKKKQEIIGNTFCWVYILKVTDTEWQIGYSHSLSKMLSNCHGKELLYYRQFPHPMDGLAHRLFLESLTSEGLYGFVRQYNAAMIDLHQEFIYNR